LIADQLDAPDNTLQGLFDPMPDGTTLQNGTEIKKWDAGANAYNVYQYSSGSWTPIGGAPVGNETLSPGEGAFIVNPTTSPFTVTFVGLVREGQLTIPIAINNSSVSSMVPQAGGITSALGCQLLSGDSIEQWVPQTQSWESFTYYGGPDGYLSPPDDWVDSNGNTTTEPIVNVGEGFFIQNGQGFPETWTQTFSACY